ncbi:MAG: carboxypeptidase-like regulatory domain-containing protein [Planctomycetota bacterium]
MTPGASYQGRVIDGGTQAPIAGAALTWKWIGASWLAGIWFLEAPPLPEITITTDPWGCFAFERIGLQTGAVHVVARGYQPYVSSEFEPQIKLFGPLTLCGVVVDPGGGPVAQANVELLGRGASALPMHGASSRSRTWSRTAGSSWRRDTRTGRPPGRRRLALPLAEPMIRLELALPARIAGMVRDADSRPAALVSVALHAIDSDALPAPRDGDRFVAASRSTDGDGRFQFDGLPAGKYLLYTQTEMGARGEVQVAAGETASITLELRRSAALQGRCLDEQDRPVASALITCLVDSSMRIAESDEHGGFALKDIPEQASVVLQAEHEGFVPSQVKAKAGDQDVLVRMGHGLTLRGVVRSRASGAPIAGAAIALETASRQQFLRAPADVSALSGDDGSFQLGPLGLGELGIVVRAAAHAPLETSLAMRSNSEPIELWLDPAILWGRVQHRSGAPAAQVAVFLLDEQGQVRGGPVTTADDGHFAFAQAEPGRGLICIGDPARPLVPPEPVSIDATTTSLARHCTLPDAATLAISLRDRTGRPVREGRVTLDYQGRGASTHGQAEVDDAGLALLAGLYPGHYRVAVESPHFALLQTTLEVADWSTCEQTLTLSHGGE